MDEDPKSGGEASEEAEGDARVEDGAGDDAESIVDEGMIEDPIGDEPSDENGENGCARLAWREGRDEDAGEDSWLGLDDDDLLLRIETLGSEEDEDDHLLEVVASTRHFFIRQEAAKRVHDRKRLFAFEEDRHVGQILVRHLTRREDLTYLERLAIRCRHVEVRSAAQVQLARVWRWLEESSTSAPSGFTPPPAAPPAEGAGHATVVTSAAVARDGVDASLLVWAAHFIVEQAWGHLGTMATRELLRRKQQDLVASHSALATFRVNDEARVVTSLAPGERVPREAVSALAAWMVGFREAGRQVAPAVHETSVRGCTALMADALRDVGFYHACDEAEAPRVV